LELLTLQCLSYVWSWTPHERTTSFASKKDSVRRQVLKISPRGLSSHMVTVRVRGHGEFRGGICKRQFNEVQLSVIEVPMLPAQ
jgi:hypothetical protein